MFEITILIPLADNDGKTFPEAHHAQFERALADRFGGVSRPSGTVAGQWINDDAVYHDTSRVYVVGLQSIVQGHLVGEAVEIAKAHYRQEAIYIRYLGQAEIL